MSSRVYRFEFDRDVPLSQIDWFLRLSALFAEGMLGVNYIRLEFERFVDDRHQAITLDGTTEVGAMILKIFRGLVLHYLGEHVLLLQRVDRPRPNESERQAA